MLNGKCNHSQTISFANTTNCVLCGSFCRHPYVAIKDENFNTRADISPSVLYANMLSIQTVSKNYNKEASYLSVFYKAINF